MSCTCSCGEKLGKLGQAHCLRHHRSFALKVGEECPDCARERDEGWVKATMGPPLGDPKFVIEALQQENADLKARVKLAEKEALEAVNGPRCPDCDDTGLLENRVEGKYPCTCITETDFWETNEEQISLLRETHYRECAEIAEGQKVGANSEDHVADRFYDRACEEVKCAILLKLEEK